MIHFVTALTQRVFHHEREKVLSVELNQHELHKM